MSSGRTAVCSSQESGAVTKPLNLGPMSLSTYCLSSYRDIDVQIMIRFWGTASPLRRESGFATPNSSIRSLRPNAAVVGGVTGGLKKSRCRPPDFLMVSFCNFTNNHVVPFIDPHIPGGACGRETLGSIDDIPATIFSLMRVQLGSFCSSSSVK